MPRSFIGSGVALDHVGDYGKLIDVHRAVNPTTMLGMVDAFKDWGKIKQLQQDLPNTQVIARVWHDHEGGFAQPPTGANDHRAMIATPEDVLGEQVELGHGSTWLHVMNEPSAFMTDVEVQRTVDWLVKFTVLAAMENCSCVLGNLADGHPPIVNGLWPALWHPFLRAVAQFPNLMRIGLHFYGPDPFINVLTAMNATCKDLGITPPQVVGTEFGLDSTGQGDRANGYQNRGWTGEQFLLWQQAQVQGPLKPFIASGQIVGLDTFQWNELWGAFSIAKDEGYHKAYKRAATKGDLDVTVTQPTKPVYVPASKPAEASGGFYYIVKFPSGAQTRNLRALPDANSADIGDVTQNDVVKLFDLPVEHDSLSRKWQFCIVVDKVTGEDKQEGWLWTDGLQLTPTTKPVAPVVVTPPVDVPLPETFPPPDTTPGVILKRWAFGFEMVATDDQCRAMTQGLELIMAGMAWVGQAAGTSVTVKPREIPMATTP